MTHKTKLIQTLFKINLACLDIYRLLALICHIRKEKKLPKSKNYFLFLRITRTRASVHPCEIL